MLNSAKKKEVEKRLNKISGQIDGLKGMVEEGRYCVDILNQIAAVRSALASAGRFILEDHLRTCVARAIKKGSGDRGIRELMDVFKKF
jgi:DNA-binding FrmR family transcriptional regulator